MPVRNLSPLLLIGLSLGAVLAVAPSGLPGIDSPLARLLTPLAAAGTDAARGSRGLIDLIRSIRTLATENAVLKADNLRLQAELEALKAVAHENQVLRAELGFDAGFADRFERLPARVVGRSPSTFLQVITLDRGSRDGVAVGQAVTSQGFFVGRVTEVTERTAQVALITASRSLIPIVTSASRATGLLKGGLAGLSGEEFPAGAGITPGESVLTSPLGEIVPGDLPVGNVEAITSSESDIITRLAIHSPIEFGKLETLVILKLPSG